VKSPLRAKVEFLRARCLLNLDRDPEALGLWRKVLEGFPDAPEAAESRFALANHYYRNKEVARAAAEYRALVKRYPQSPRAAAARRWAGWSETHDETWAELEQVLAGWARRVQEAPEVMAFTLRVDTGDPKWAVECRLAGQSGKGALFAMGVGVTRFVAAQNEEGLWFVNLGDNTATRVRHKKDLQMPCFSVNYDPDKRRLAYGVGFTSSSKVPTLIIPASIAPNLVSRIQEEYHLTKHVRHPGRPEEQVIYHLESAGKLAAEPDVIDVEVDSRRMLLQVRYTQWISEARKVMATLSDLQLSGQLPQDALALKLPKGIAIRDGAEGAEFEWFSQLQRVILQTVDRIRLQEKR
jgi:hypothetical protein